MCRTDCRFYFRVSIPQKSEWNDSQVHLWLKNVGMSHTKNVGKPRPSKVTFPSSLPILLDGFNPYIKITQDGITLQKTGVKWDSSQPVWDQELILPVTSLPSPVFVCSVLYFTTSYILNDALIWSETGFRVRVQNPYTPVPGKIDNQVIHHVADCPLNWQNTLHMIL